MTQCEMCQKLEDYGCKFCSFLGNLCQGCEDYDMEYDKPEGDYKNEEQKHEVPDND